MKKAISMMIPMIISLLFVGCTEDTFPNEGAEKTESPLETAVKREVTEECSEEIDEEKYSISEQEFVEDKEIVSLTLSEEELDRIRLTAEGYYISINREMLSFAQADPNSSYNQKYDGYEPDEVVLFEVSVEGSENKRYITIGSKDGWNNCSVLNEGY